MAEPLPFYVAELLDGVPAAAKEAEQPDGCEHDGGEDEEVGESAHGMEQDPEHEKNDRQDEK